MTAIEAKKAVIADLKRFEVGFSSVTAKTIDFTDLARDSIVKVTVKGVVLDDNTRRYIDHLEATHRKGYIVNFEWK